MGAAGSIAEGTTHLSLDECKTLVADGAWKEIYDDDFTSMVRLHIL